MDFFWGRETGMDWSGCDLVEVIPGKVSGAPLVKNTRIPADLVLHLIESDYTVEAILQSYPSLTAEIVQKIGNYAASRKLCAVA
jgi:uncharacterized protein (DUF433 family)